MSTCEDVRKHALALEGVEEVDHWGRPAFRTKQRIFITLRPEEQRAMFHIPEEHQELLFELRGDAFEPLDWGKTTRCFVNLSKVPVNEISALIREAWEYSLPSKRRTRGTRTAKERKVPGRKAR
jgi:hypothetical protein